MTFSPTAHRRVLRGAAAHRRRLTTAVPLRAWGREASATRLCLPVSRAGVPRVALALRRPPVAS